MALSVVDRQSGSLLHSDQVSKAFYNAWYISSSPLSLSSVSLFVCIACLHRPVSAMIRVEA